MCVDSSKLLLKTNFVLCLDPLIWLKQTIPFCLMFLLMVQLLSSHELWLGVKSRGAPNLLPRSPLSKEQFHGQR